MTSTACAQRVLVIGAYGLIGYGIAKQLQADGHDITGLGRNAQTATRVIPEISWVFRDIRSLIDAEHWLSLIHI